MRYRSVLDVAPPANRSGWPWVTSGAQDANDASSDRGHWPRITVVTPSYNQGAYLEATIRSVLLQRYPNLEYIVIDGGSTDGSVEIIKKYEPWLTYWCSEPDQGQADAINKGFARATGDIFGWLNSDDIYEPAALRVIARAFAENPNADFVYGNGWQIDADGVRTARCDWVGPLDRRIQLNWNQILQPAAFWRSATWRRVGPLTPSYNWGLDWEWFIRATSRGKTLFVPNDLAAWRITPEIKSVSTDPARRAELASISRRHGGPLQPTYLMYRLDQLAQWMVNHFGRGRLGRIPQIPVTAVRLILHKRFAGRYVS